ncbi:MFI2 (predicted) [Pycnogonum litorale]
MRMVSGGEADTVNVGPEDAYVGDKLFDLQPLLFEEINSALYRYRAAAIVRTDLDITTLSDLRGKNSCHTGYKKTSGWNVPVALMIADGIIQTNCSGDELASVANFFSASCVPGKWAHTNETDSKLSKIFGEVIIALY